MARITKYKTAYMKKPICRECDWRKPYFPSVGMAAALANSIVHTVCPKCGNPDLENAVGRYEVTTTKRWVRPNDYLVSKFILREEENNGN